MTSLHTPARPLRGIAWMLLQCLVFSVLSVMTHRLSQDISGVVIYFVNIVTVLLMMMPWVMFTKGQQLTTSTLPLYFVRAIAGAASMLTWFYALRYAPVTEATAISFTTPLFTCTLAVLFLKEHIGHHRIIALIIGFAGAMILLQPSTGGLIATGSAMALLAAILWAICDILIKYQLRSDSYNTQIFYIALFMALITLPLAIWQWQTPTKEQFGWMVVIGMLFFVNFHALFRAYNHADLSVVMPFDFSRLIFTSMMAYYFFDETPNHHIIVGAGIIVGSTIYITYLERAAAPIPRIKK